MFNIWAADGAKDRINTCWIIVLKGGGRTGGKEESKAAAARSLVAKGTMKTRAGCHGEGQEDEGCCCVLRGPFPRGTFSWPAPVKPNWTLCKGRHLYEFWGTEYWVIPQWSIIPSALVARHWMNSAIAWKKYIFLLPKFQHLDLDDYQKLSISVKKKSDFRKAVKYKL